MNSLAAHCWADARHAMTEHADPDAIVQLLADALILDPSIDDADECHRCGTPHRRESSYCSEACADEAAYDEEMRRMLAAMHASAGDLDGAL